MRLPKPFRSPVCQLVIAVVVMLCGAVLVAWWMVGVVLMAGGLLVAADAVLRDTTAPLKLGSHEDVLERWRRAS